MLTSVSKAQPQPAVVQAELTDLPVWVATPDDPVPLPSPDVQPVVTDASTAVRTSRS